MHTPNSLDLSLGLGLSSLRTSTPFSTLCAHCPAQSGIPQAFGKTSRRGSLAALPPGLLLNGWTSAYQETDAFLPYLS